VTRLVHAALAAAALPSAFAQSGGAPRSPHGYTRNVAVLVFEGVELLDFAGPVEVFSVTRGWDTPFQVYTVGVAKRPLRTHNVVTIVPDFTIADCPPPDVLVIPGGETEALDAWEPLGRFVIDRVPRVEVAFSVCNGAFCLADAGFLDGLEATTFSLMNGWLQQAAPKARVRRDVRWVDNGHIVMTAGVSAGIDGALHLVDRLLGRASATRAAGRMEYAWTDAPKEPEAAATDPIVAASRLWYAEDWLACAKAYAALADGRPSDAIVLARLGTALVFSKMNAEGLAALERAVRIDGSDALALHALGLAQSRAERHADAAATLGSARALDPDSIALRLFLGLEQFEIGECAGAVENIFAALAQRVGDDRARLKLALAHLACGERVAALSTIARTAPSGDDVGIAPLLDDARFDSIRAEPESTALKERLARAR